MKGPLGPPNPRGGPPSGIHAVETNEALLNTPLAALKGAERQESGLTQVEEKTPCQFSDLRGDLDVVLNSAGREAGFSGGGGCKRHSVACMPASAQASPGVVAAAKAKKQAKPFRLFLCPRPGQEGILGGEGFPLSPPPAVSKLPIRLLATFPVLSSKC
jgi:hypothetical protein